MESILAVVGSVVVRTGNVKLRRTLAAFFLAVGAALAAGLFGAATCAAHDDSHTHHAAGQSSPDVQTGQFMMFSAGPNVIGPNYLLNSVPLMASQPYYPPFAMNSGGFGWTAQGAPLQQGALLPPVANVMNPVGPAGDGGFSAPSSPAPAPAHVHSSNDASRARAHQFVRFGDEHFRKQKYNDALERYKDASRSAPDLADPYFRQALAWSAMKKYDQAARAIRHGLSLNAGWAGSGFELSQVYGDNRLAKAAHWETLAQAATLDPQNADLLFLLAVELYFDGQQARSRPFFQRAKSLEPGDVTHIRAFLDRLDAAAGRPQPAPTGQL